MISPKMLQENRELLQLGPFAGIHQQCRARKIAFAGSVQLRKYRNQIDGQIIDAVEIHVLEGFKDSTFPGAREAGQDDKLPPCRSFPALHARSAGQLFTLR